MDIPKASTQTSDTSVREHDDASAVELDDVPQTALGRLAVAARREYFASGGHPLSRDEIEREVAERRGGTHLLRDQ